MTTPCMGGWCLKREYCMNHNSTSQREPAERLCIPGHDGKGADTAVVIFRPVGSWERGASTLLRQASPMELAA